MIVFRLTSLMTALICAVITVFSPFVQAPAVMALAAPTASQTDQAEPVQGTETTEQPVADLYPDRLTIEHSAANAIVIDSNRGRILYTKAADERLEIPAANKMMTALIATEKLTLDTKVTISKVAAGFGYKEASDDGVVLKTGDKYSAEYLLLRLLFYDSNAAAIALAEQIANEEPEFVKLMNARADTYGLKDTNFVTASGEPPVLTVPDGTSVTDEQTQANAQHTTLNDMAKLVQQALQNDKFSRLFRKSTDYIVLDGMSLIPMTNRLSQLWPYSEGRVSGAFLSRDPKTGLATSISLGAINGFGIISILVAGNANRVVWDVLALYDACESTYENTPLVTAGEAFTGAQEKTLDGEVFGLVYQKTVNYIHPVGDLYLTTPVQYNSFGPFSRPIQTTMTVGQVVFTLQDGSRIAVDVAPDRQILSSISLVDRTLSLLAVNRNLYFLLIILLAALVITIVIRAIFVAARLKNRSEGIRRPPRPPGRHSL